MRTNFCAETLFPRLVCYGRFDGSALSLAAATTGNRIFLHNPCAMPQNGELPIFLRIASVIRALASGALSFLH
jgi:hypothetical protein